jgi:hypothetical protein
MSLQAACQPNVRHKSWRKLQDTYSEGAFICYFFKEILDLIFVPSSLRRFCADGEQEAMSFMVVHNLV